MHPLTIFPSLLTFGLIAPLVLRLTVGVLRLFAGFYRYKKEYKWISIFHFISSALLILGLFTQIAALAGIALLFFDYFMEKKSGTLSGEKTVLTVLMTAILLSLLFTGPGFLAFDLPL